MALNIIDRLRSFCSSAFRLAAALTMAAIALGAVGLAAQWAYTYPEREQAKQAEAVRQWLRDMSSNLNLKVRAKTKVTAGTMHLAVEIDGHPKYLNLPENREQGFYLEWTDADGFTRIHKFVKVSEFSRRVNDEGEPYGLSGQFAETVTVADYSAVTAMRVGWNLTTTIPQPPPPPAPQAQAPRPQARAPRATPSPEGSDHCATGLSKTERLNRLAQYGQVRNTGYGEYTAGGHLVHFLIDGDELYRCR